MVGVFALFEFVLCLVHFLVGLHDLLFGVGLLLREFLLVLGQLYVPRIYQFFPFALLILFLGQNGQHAKEGPVLVVADVLGLIVAPVVGRLGVQDVGFGLELVRLALVAQRGV